MRRLHRYRHAPWSERRKHIGFVNYRLRRLDRLTSRFFREAVLNNAFQNNIVFQMLWERRRQLNPNP